MKYLFASDIHGSAFYCRKLMDAYLDSGAERLILLGDILYHGPRNEQPKEYNPKKVIELLNEIKQEIYAVRGNCDSEVDQMVLEFPILADYCLLVLNGLTFYGTHGHMFNSERKPPMQQGDILIHGHTHVLGVIEADGNIVVNPGSVSLPKEDNPPSYGILEEKIFTIYSFDNAILKQVKL